MSHSNSLIEIHERLGAQMKELDTWSVPASYGDVLREYAAVRESGVGVVDLTPRGRIRVSGTEAVQFLNGLISNDMKTLAENKWMPAVFPNVQGRLIASVRVIRVSDEPGEKAAVPVFIIDTESATHDRVLKTVERFTLAGDFRVTDLTETTALISIQGHNAAEFLTGVFGDLASASSQHGVAPIQWKELELLIIHATNGFDLIVSSESASDLWETLVAAGARPVGYEALEILRIEAGTPRYGVDIDESLVVSETNLDEAVSFTKGCYIGQEIIARIKYRGHVAKKLTGLVLDSAVNITSGTTVRSSDDKEIGRVTSITYSPHLGKTIALAILKYQYLAAGTQVKVVAGEEEFGALVSELPFIKNA